MTILNGDFCYRKPDICSFDIVSSISVIPKWFLMFTKQYADLMDCETYIYVKNIRFLLAENDVIYN